MTTGVVGKVASLTTIGTTTSFKSNGLDIDVLVSTKSIFRFNWE